jgi:hypothetical protein
MQNPQGPPLDYSFLGKLKDAVFLSRYAPEIVIINAFYSERLLVGSEPNGGVGSSVTV